MAQARRNRKSKTPAWVWLVVGILLGFFFSHLDFLEAYRFLEASIEKNQKFNQIVARHAPTQETKFDFYNILSEGSSTDNKMDLDTSKQRRNSDNRSTSKLAAVKEFEGRSERRSKAYKEMHETLSGEPMQKLPTAVEFRKRSNVVQEINSASHKKEKKELSDSAIKTQAPRLPAVENKDFQEKVTLKEEGVRKIQPGAVLEKPTRKSILDLVRDKPMLPTFKEKTSKNLEEKYREEKHPEGKHVEQKQKTEKLVLQIAALRGYAEADRLKAQLLLLGFQGVQLFKINKGQSVWYRVTVGNYSNKKDAESAKRRLQQNNVNSTIVPK